MEIKGDDYQTSYDPETATLIWKGKFRLQSREYAPILEQLNEIADQKSTLINFHLEEVSFMNSTGISMLCKFVDRLDQLKVTKLVIHHSTQYPWQKRSLKNLERLLPTIEFKSD